MKKYPFLFYLASLLLFGSNGIVASFVKLAPYAEQIKAWQAKGMTLREIAAELKNYGCVTTA